MTEKEIMALKKKIQEKTSSPEELLELLRELNFSFLELNQKLKDLQALKGLKNSN